MNYKKDPLPLGKLLQTAGLISELQLEEALLLQSEYTSMKLGEILALQEIIKTSTVIFFVDRWGKIKQKGQQFPLGYYLEKAGLLNEQQIKTILSEQKNQSIKFGKLAVEKGWIEEKTVNFFLSSLSEKQPRLISLMDLEKYNQEHLHLELKYMNAPLILGRILAWTGGNPKLTISISHVFADSNLNIAEGMERTTVDKLIEDSLIRNWQTSQLGTYIKSIQESWLNNSRCEPNLLLEEYQQILLHDRHEYRQTKQQQELLALGIIVKEQGKLRVANLIYQQVFNRDWLIKSQKNLKSNKQLVLKSGFGFEPVKIDNSIEETTLEKDIVIANNILTKLDRESNHKIETLEKNILEAEQNYLSPLTKLASLLTLAGCVLLIPFVLAINNYYTGLQSKRRTTLDSVPQASKLEQFCDEINLIDPPSTLNLIYQLEKNQQKLGEQKYSTSELFPDNCQTALNQLRILAVPQLGKENRVIEAVKNLCKIPADSENINEAKVWLERWYDSAAWGKETQSYVNLVESCPAGNLLK